MLDLDTISIYIHCRVCASFYFSKLPEITSTMKRIKIALISFYANDISTRSLASYLRDNGFAVFNFFCTASFNDANLNKLIEIITEKQAALVGITVLTDYFRQAALLTNKIKETSSLPVIWGGPHVDVRPEECLSYADMICLGEGEEALLELATGMSIDAPLKTEIKNIWFRTDAGITANGLRNLEEDIDRYPPPDFDLNTKLVMSDAGFERLSEKHLKGEYGMVSSRGCPYSCRYCYNNYRRRQYEGKGKYVRTLSIDYIIRELVMAKGIFANLKTIHFWDDNFLVRDKSELERFKQMYSEKIGVPFTIMADPLTLSREKITILKECGLTQIQIGIQSGSERINRQIYNRAVSRGQLLDIANFLNQLGITPLYDIIFNNPYEARNDVMETVKLLLELPRPYDLQGVSLIFHPGTEITEQALKDGFILPRSQKEDFSTIQGRENSPFLAKGRAIVSNRFYIARYDIRDKEYLNAVIFLFSLVHFPLPLIKFFSRHENSVTRILLRISIELYLAARKLRRAL